MDWRDRIEAAREREQAWFWRRWWEQRLNPDWPFTAADEQTWARFETCLAGEVADRYGLEIDSTAASQLYKIGNRWLDGAAQSAAATERLLEEIELRALELKREQGTAHGV